MWRQNVNFIKYCTLMLNGWCWKYPINSICGYGMNETNQWEWMNEWSQEYEADQERMGLNALSRGDMIWAEAAWRLTVIQIIAIWLMDAFAVVFIPFSACLTGFTRFSAVDCWKTNKRPVHKNGIYIEKMRISKEFRWIERYTAALIYLLLFTILANCSFSE